MLSKDQAQQMKQQLIEHIKQTFPEEKKQGAIDQILGMDEEQFEQFAIQNKLITDEENPKTPEQPKNIPKCIFCSIIFGDAQSFKIDENKDAIAILEINPISKGHSLIIPKKHLSSSDKIPNTIFSLAKKIGKKIQTKFKPKDIQIYSSNIMGHEIVNVLPIYENETVQSQRKSANPEEISKIQKLLEKKSTIKKISTPKTKIIKEKMYIPRRIP
ncbi:MAG: Histidine triad (HIT) protein [archaeon GW2011_AR13]|nr:MAG: Histidine triad (HIT) protein [archaeon GW2011_AR13]HIG94755.1 HIT domain-containing protein [Nanoarchaeota archaeon]HIH63721.1 HIT domain-containing protein [Nanoarchaeota archaeon]HIJ09594.1 HIT domain-containing protein [Nanoarchaeota archaeon]